MVAPARSMCCCAGGGEAPGVTPFGAKVRALRRVHGVTLKRVAAELLRTLKEP